MKSRKENSRTALSQLNMLISSPKHRIPQSAYNRVSTKSGPPNLDPLLDPIWTPSGPPSGPPFFPFFWKYEKSRCCSETFKLGFFGLFPFVFFNIKH